MNYEVQFSEKALKTLKKMDPYQSRLIIGWIEKNLVECQDPRVHGKALVGDKKGYWRYRIGSYRLIADIQDDIVRIDIISIAHRREVYDIDL